MPTVLLIFGLRVVVYLNDHRPAHVHVQGKGCEAVFNLACPDGPLQPRENYGFSRSELNRIGQALQVQIGPLCDAWRKLHGFD